MATLWSLNTGQNIIIAQTHLIGTSQSDLIMQVAIHCMFDCDMFIMLLIYPGKVCLLHN